MLSSDNLAIIHSFECSLNGTVNEEKSGKFITVICALFTYSSLPPPLCCLWLMVLSQQTCVKIAVV